MEITYKTDEFNKLIEKEVDEFIDLCHMCHQYHNYQYATTREKFVETIRPYQNRPNSYIIRAFDDTKLVGSIMLLDIAHSRAVSGSIELMQYFEENNIDRTKSAITTELWVDPNYFSQGIAKSLNKQVEVLAKEVGFKHFVFFAAFEARTLRWYHAHYRGRITQTDIQLLPKDETKVFLVDIT